MWTDRHAAALSSVFDALNNSGIEWMVLRNYEGLPKHNRSKDIDLCIADKDCDKAAVIISRVLKLKGFNRIYTANFLFARCLTFFCSIGEDVISIKIDLVDGVPTRGTHLFDHTTLYTSRERYMNFFVPSLVDNAVMLWAKPLIMGTGVKANYINEILTVSATERIQFHRKLIRYFGSKIGNQVWRHIEQGDLAGTIKYKNKLIMAAWVQSIRRNVSKTLSSTFKYIYLESIRRLRRKPGCFVAVVGPDGVGKTTFIQLLKKELADIYVKDPNAVDLKHFRPHILPNIKQLLSAKKYDASSEEFNKPHRAKPASRSSSLIRISYYWFDYVIGYWLHVRRGCIAGKVYIFDRYFYDFVVDPHRSRINLPNWIRKLFLSFTPQPDIVLFLDCDAETIYSRKQELERDEIERQLKEYRNLVNTYPKRFVKLDAHQPPHVSCQTALKALVDRLIDPIL